MAGAIGNVFGMMPATTDADVSMAMVTRDDVEALEPFQRRSDDIERPSNIAVRRLQYRHSLF